MSKFVTSAILLALGCADASSLRLSKLHQAPPAEAGPALPPLPDFSEQCDALSDTTPVDTMVLAVNSTASTIADQTQSMMMDVMASVSDMKAGLANESLDAVEKVQDKLMGLAMASGSKSDSISETMDKSFAAFGPKFSSSADGVQASLENAQKRISALGEGSFSRVEGSAEWPWSSSPSKEQVAQTALSKANSTVLAFPSVLEQMNATLVEALDGMVQAMQQSLANFEAGCNVVAASISDGDLADIASKLTAACSGASELAASLPGIASDAADTVSSEIAGVQATVDSLSEVIEKMQSTLDAILAAKQLQ